MKLLWWFALLPLTLVGADAPTPKLMLNVGGHTAPVQRVVFTPDGRRLLSVSVDGTARIWDWRTGRSVHVWRTPFADGSQGKLLAAAVSPDGSTAAIGGTGRVSAGGDGSPVYLLDIETGALKGTLSGNDEIVFDVSFSCDGKYVACGLSKGFVQIWDTTNRATVGRLRVGENPISAAVFSPTEPTILSTLGDGGEVQIWALKLPDKLGDSKQLALNGKVVPDASLSWSPDGKRLAAGDNQGIVRLWDIEVVEPRIIKNLKNGVFSLAFTPSGRELLICRGFGERTRNQPSLLDVETAIDRVPNLRERTNNWAAYGAVSPDGQFAATSGDDDHAINIWKTDKTLSLVRRLGGGTLGGWSAAWHADRPVVAFGHTRSPEPGNRNPLDHVFGLEEPGPVDVKENFIPGFMKDAERRLEPIILPGRAFPRKLSAFKGAKKIGEVTSPIGQISAATLFRDGTSRVAVGTDGGDLYLFDGDGGERLRTFAGHSAEIRAVSSSQDGRFLLTASSDQVFHVWSTEGKVQSGYTGVGLSMAAATDDGVRVLSVAADGDAAGKIRADDMLLAVSSDGEQFVTLCGEEGGKNRTKITGPAGTRVWLRLGRKGVDDPLEFTLTRKPLIEEAPRSMPLLSLFVAGDEWVAWTPEGYYAASSGGEELVGWRVDRGVDRRPDFYPARQFHASLYRPDVVRLLFKTDNVADALAAADKLRAKPNAAKPRPIEGLAPQAPPAPGVNAVVEVIPPEVRLIFPPSEGRPARLSQEAGVIRAQVDVAREEVLEVKLLIDGREIRVEPRGLPDGGRFSGKTELAWNVNFARGEHKVDVFVGNGNSSELVSGKVVLGAPLPGRNRLYVLAIGVGEIAGAPGKRIASAPGSAAHVAAAFASASKRVYREAPLVRVLATDGPVADQPTRDNVIEAIDRIRDRIGPNDTFVLYFCGHGMLDDNRYFLLTQDVDLNQLAKTALRAETLASAIRDCQGTVVFLLESCHAGAFGGQPFDLYEPFQLESSAVHLGGACKSSQEASDASPAPGIGVYAHFLVEGLTRGEGRVSLEDLMLYVKENVRAYIRKKDGKEQTPWWRFARAGVIDPDEIVFRLGPGEAER